MDINKLDTKILDDTVRLSIPIQKVDKERRTVSGFATLDNADKHGDIVTSEASVNAFKSFRGNIREMHMPIAVGKMVKFEQKTYTDPETNKSYNGVYVEVYVSKGAQDTWEKVLDRTLSGFSIGGNFDPDSVEYIERMDGTQSRIINSYELVELSLVDNPANQLANVFSIQKASDGSNVYKGFAVENEDFEETDPVSETTDLEPLVLETEEPRMDKVLSVLERLEEFFTKTFGGNSMTTKTEETAVVEEEVVDTETEEDTTVEKAADVSEVEVETTSSPDEPAIDTDAIVDAVVAKVTDTLVEKVLERLESVEETTDEVVTEDKDLETVEKSVDETNSALASVVESLESLTKVVEEFKDSSEERFDALEENTAVKKSVTLNHTAKVRSRDKNADFWGNTALGGTKTSA